jgi:phosphatidylserine decarboxylase
MMRRFFLEREYFVWIVVLTVFFLFAASFWFFLLWSLLLTGFFYLVRRRKQDYKDRLSDEDSILLSPVNGLIYAVESDSDLEGHEGKFTLLRVSVAHLDEWGVYMPFRGEIDGLARNKGKSIFRYENKLSKFKENDLESVKIQINSKKLNYCVLNILKCAIGLKPRIWVEPGDRGSSGSCIGYMPFGGTVLVYLPSNFEVIVKANDQLLAGETVLAGQVEE